ncbi:MAG TPA: Ig-like domain-containing protein, partial [Blastocatellia bacterium]
DPGSPLEIVLTTPAMGATDVSTGITPAATFSRSLTLGSLSIGNPDIATILLRDASNNPVPFSLYVHVPMLRTILIPVQELQPGQTYTVTFKGGPDAPHITDEAGMPLASDYNLSFTTGTAPQEIVSVTPAPGAFSVPTSVAPTATFSEPLDPASVNESTVLLNDVWNDPVPATISYDASAFKITIRPALPLQPGSLYTVTIKGGASAPHITDAAGTPLASDYTWSFAAAISPSALPILVITSTENNFTQYYPEILRAEGFNSVNAMDITQITSSTLAQYDVAILGETPLTSAQVTMLSNWVTAGGNLIAMRPDKQLASLLGITDVSSVQPDAYLLVNTAQEPGAGIVNQTIQYHGPADLYTLDGATAVAAIYSDRTQITSNPAVTLRSVGANGGHAAAFAFDLARSIVYTRQGNPAWMWQDRAGKPPIRTNDPLFGGSDPDYVNFDKAAIPHDELQRLLGTMILSIIADRRTLPRFWYLPNMKKAAIMMTGDDHGAPDGK